MILKSKLNVKNKIQAINTWVVALLRYEAEIINCKVDDLKRWTERQERLSRCMGP